jgi:acyl carrier protein
MEADNEASKWVRAALSRACLCAPEAVRDEWRLIDLGVDSLTLISIASELEARYGAEFPEPELQMLLESRTVSDLIRMATVFSQSAVRSAD